jgi:hypothetical protein
VRIWDLEPDVLCDRHLLGEHRELHGVWSILTTGKRGYANHPETLRWGGRLKALYVRHDGLVKEMKRRGFEHRSPLDSELATGAIRQTELLESIERQRERLRLRDCPCFRDQVKTGKHGSLIGTPDGTRAESRHDQNH